MRKELIFSFDLGAGSVGECVRQGGDVKYLASLLLPSEYASTKDSREKRRQVRTRRAHCEREKWWKEKAKEAGLDVLETRQPTREEPDLKPDPRMLREFPAKGDKTIYTSCLLRIALLQGKHLEAWQVYKAIWSAIQHRGYDFEIPWKNNLEKDDQDEKANREAVREYEKYLEKYFGNKKEFWRPCYYEAYRMGIWTPDQPEKLDGKIGTNPKPARNREGSGVHAIAPRKYVEKELDALLDNAGEYFPMLRRKKKEIIYGPGQERYASFNKPEYKKYRGREWDWQGLLGQKMPRFDNRSISKCVLIPRFNVCKAKDALYREMEVLLNLKNIRYINISGEKKSLTATEIKELFENNRNRLDDGKKSFLTKRDWKRWLKNKGEVYPAMVEVPNAKVKGRSRFCRPAMKIMKELIISGQNPHDFYKECMNSIANTDPRKGLIKEDYRFLLKMPDNWNNIHIPDSREDEARLMRKQALAQVDFVINRVREPIVRHRLQLFKRRLQNLTAKFGLPDRVVLELVREPKEGLGGTKRKLEYQKIISANKKARDDAREKAEELGLKSNDSVLRVLLFQEQCGMDFYDNNRLEANALDLYDIDHIVPRSQGGPDSYINKILTKAKNNSDKGDRTPFEWLSRTERWGDLINSVQSNDCKLSKKKISLLISEDAANLVEKYTALAQTAYVAKLSKRIVSLFFGWADMAKTVKKKIIVVNGAYTAKLRRKYKVDYLLHPDLELDEFKILLREGKIEEKNRKNPKHHALDALMASLSLEEKYDNEKKESYLPEWFNRDFCCKLLDAVVPVNIAFEKPKLAETIYGLRKISGEAACCMTTRFGVGTSIEEFYDLTNAQKYVSAIFDKKIRRDFEKKMKTAPTKEEWKHFVKEYACGGKPRKIRLMASKEFKGVSKDTVQIGEYKNITKMKGQYAKDKREHRGQIVYKNEKGRWKVEPVYVFESMWKKIKAYKEKFANTFFFQSGQLVKLEFGDILPVGYYKLRTIKTNGQVGLDDLNGVKIKRDFSINTLMDNGLCPVQFPEVFE